MIRQPKVYYQQLDILFNKPIDKKELIGSLNTQYHAKRLLRLTSGVLQTYIADDTLRYQKLKELIKILSED